MSEKISRRAALATTGRAAVAVLAGGGVAVAAVGEDGELLRLEREVNASIERWRELSDVWNDIQGKVFEVCPPWPDSDRSLMPEEIAAQFKKITVGELATIQEVAPDHPYAAWMRENEGKVDAAYRRCHAERDRIMEEYGEPAADEAQSAQMDRTNELCHELLATRATSLTGIAVKLRLREWMDYDEGYEAILNSIEDDLLVMAGEPPREVDEDEEAEGDTDA